MQAIRSASIVALALAAAVPAQEKSADPGLQQAQARLDKALAHATAQPNGTFKARWDASEAGGGVVVFMANQRAGAPQGEMNGKASGCWSGDLLSAHYDNGDHDLLQCGRRSAVRDGTGAWKLSRDRFADGSNRGYLPDPPQLTALFAQLGAKVVHREVGALDDRPMETLSVILSGPAAEQAMLAGLLPPVAAGFVVAFGGAPGTTPALIDLAFHLDPATGTIHRIDGRIHANGNVVMGGGVVRVFAAGGGAVLAQQPQDDKAEEDDKRLTFDQACKQEPTEFKAGLPVRKLKDCSTTRFELRLSELGSTKAPAIDPAAAALLGR